MRCAALFPLAAALCLTQGGLSAEGPVAWWRFDEGQGTVVTDAAGGRVDRLQGHLSFGPGVRGMGLRFDGFTSRVVRATAEAPRLKDAFTLEAWIAPQEYSWNLSAIVDQESGRTAGFFFGIDHLGRIVLQAAAGGAWRECASRDPLPLLPRCPTMGA